MISEPTTVQQLYMFLDSWLRFVAITAICLTPAMIVALAVLVAALLVRPESKT